MPIDPRTIPEAPPENAPAAAAHESAEMLAAMALRRSTKIADFVEPGPDDDQIAALIRLAARVPDHGKLGPWRFVLIAGEARARAGEKLAELIVNDDGVDEVRIDFAKRHFLRAPACVMIVSTAAPHPKIPEWEQTLSSGAVCMNMLLAAHAMGFAACWLTEWPTYDERARGALGLAAHERVAGFIYLGTAGKPATERFRADLDGRVSHF
ncbi:MAG TPA: nitroreductase [Caulobacterales bacterium]|nr:nitroreductase [Caulobacterales bacterium]